MRWAIIMQDAPSWCRVRHFGSLMTHMCYEVLYNAQKYVILKEYTMIDVGPLVFMMFHMCIMMLHYGS